MQPQGQLTIINNEQVSSEKTIPFKDWNVADGLDLLFLF